MNKEIEEIEKAIEHCREVQRDNCTNDLCRLEHSQLGLNELLLFKKSVD